MVKMNGCGRSNTRTVRTLTEQRWRAFTQPVIDLSAYPELELPPAVMTADLRKRTADGIGRIVARSAFEREEGSRVGVVRGRAGRKEGGGRKSLLLCPACLTEMNS